MKNDDEPMQHENSNSAQSIPTTPSPPYSNRSQYPPTSGIPYPQQYPPPAPVMGYPQPYAPAPGGQPYYPPPGVVYPGPPGPNFQASQPPQQQQQQQQQEQQVVVVNSQPTGVAPVATRAYVSMVGAVALSCCVFWCGFGCLCGGIAFILAMVGESSASAGDAHGAIQMRKASYGLSIAGIVCTIIIIIAVVAVNVHVASNPGYSYTTRSTLSRCYDSYSGYYYYC